MNDEFKKSLPPIIYKFRDWENPYHRKTLTHDSLYFARQNELNDPLDALIPFSYKKDQMTPENIEKKLFETAQSRWPRSSRKELEVIVKQRMKDVDFRTNDYWITMIPTFQEMVNKKLGILSMAKTWDNHALWTHYGNSHKGFCLGFNTEKFFQSIGGLIGEVVYSDEPNEVDLFDDSLKGLAKAIMQKSPDYKFESEIRIAKIGFAGKPILFPDGSLEEIILGYSMTEGDKSKILEVARMYHRTTRVYQTKFDPTTRKLMKTLLF